MSNKLSAVLILCMSSVGLAGCDLLRVAGPCYGVGCPGGTAGRNGQYKPGEAPKAQNASTPAPAPVRTASAPAQSANAPAQTASAPAQSNIVQPNAPTQTTSAPEEAASAAPQPAAAQSSAAQPTPAQADSVQAGNAHTATAQPAPAQDASSEAKSSPLHSIGEFFARLIPHHNSGAKSGASY
jgi:hypothetical protein